MQKSLPKRIRRSNNLWKCGKEPLINCFSAVLDNPSLQTYEEIDGMKNEIMLKLEELKLKIDQESDILVNMLDEYIEKFMTQLNDEKFKKRSNDLLFSDFKSHFNSIILDKTWWKAISSEILCQQNQLTKNLDEFNKSLVIHEGLEEIKQQTHSLKDLPLKFSLSNRYLKGLFMYYVKSLFFIYNILSLLFQKPLPIINPATNAAINLDDIV